MHILVHTLLKNRSFRYRHQSIERLPLRCHSDVTVVFHVSTEISSHDLFRHSDVQLLQFSVSFRPAERQIGQLLYEELAQSAVHQEICVEYENRTDFEILIIC